MSIYENQEENIIHETAIGTFSYVEDSEKIRKCISQLEQVYPLKLDQIAAYMLANGLTDLYGQRSIDQVKDGLGKPYIYPETEEIFYTDHKFDQEHILSLEYEGFFESFSNFSIDG